MEKTINSMNSKMFKQAQREAYAILEHDQSGHGTNHIERVLWLTERFARQEKANLEVALMIALLHDVDDYKLFGQQGAETLPHASLILDHTRLPIDTKQRILAEIHRIGYGKRLSGTQPESLEGRVVADADMCDALGATSIVRICEFGCSHHRPFFLPDSFPNQHLSAQKYRDKNGDSSVCHFFEKILRLQNLMLTTSGKQEAMVRHRFVIDFLRQFFAEQNAPEWAEYLEHFLAAEQDNAI